MSINPVLLSGEMSIKRTNVSIIYEFEHPLYILSMANKTFFVAKSFFPA